MSLQGSMLNRLEALTLIFDQDVDKEYDYKSDSFPEQIEFIEYDEGDLILCGSRRCGKTGGIPRKLIKTALMGSKFHCAYVTDTRDTGRNILWRELKEILSKNEIAVEIDNTRLQVRFKKTGSIIYFMSAGTEDQQVKIRGMAMKLIVIDEAQNFKINLKKFCEQDARGCLSDLQGQLVMTGTPHPTCAGYFYDCFHDGKSKTMHWDWRKNKFFVEKMMKNRKTLKTIDDCLERLLFDYKLPENDPIVQREVFGRWVRSTNLLVYKYDPVKNVCQIPPAEKHWQYVIGIDLGFEDHNAISVLAYDCYTGNTYLVDEFKQNKMSVSELAPEIIKRQDKYNPICCVMDTSGLSKMVQDEYNKRADFKIGIVAADRQNKFDSIGFMNDDFQQEKLWLPANSQTGDEMLKLVYDDKAYSVGKYMEKPGLANHLCDATKYAWDWLNTYIRVEKPKAMDRWSEEGMRENDELEFRRGNNSYDSLW